MGSTPRRQKRSSTPRLKKSSTNNTAPSADSALATVDDSRTHEDFGSAFADAFLYLPDDSELSEPAAVEDVAPVELPYLDWSSEPASANLPSGEASSTVSVDTEAPVAPVEASASAAPAKKSRRSRAKSKAADAVVERAASEPPAETPVATKAPKRPDRRKKASETPDSATAAPKPRRRKTDTIAAAPAPMPEPDPESDPQPQRVAAEVTSLVAHAPDVVEPEPQPTADPQPWVDLVLEPTPSTKTTDEWVDQVLEPVKIPLPKPRPQAVRSATAVAKPAVKSVAKTAPAAVKRTNAPATRPAGAPTSDAAPTRWWLVAVAFLLVAFLAFANRPAKGHAPLPAELLGVWTTDFWKYEKQTLELLPDTVVLTLDGPEERRYPITKVETADAGRETAVKVTYRLRAGDEKELDFLADRDPTTALRFRAHSGLVWVRYTP